MSSIKRRKFLQAASSTLIAVGWNQAIVRQQGNQYGKVLAQSTPRKLALLIGVNAYQSWPSLSGCLNDVRLQKELLIHRFGFKESDILTLTDAEATRYKILEGFEEHLIGQARDNDVVVVHFSGHGISLNDPDPISQSGCNGSLVPVDGQPSSSSTGAHIMGRTIFLLMSALKTKHVTFTLDSCFSGAATRGNIRIRSVGSGVCAEPAPEELEYQERWLSRLSLSAESFKQQRQIGAAKGAVLAAAQARQLAVDFPFDDGAFNAGLFTYLMTQYLWEQTSSSSFRQTITDVSDRMQELVYQQPLLDTNPLSNDQQPFYFTTKESIPIEAVVTNVTGDKVELWLGGIRPRSLAAFRGGALLSVADGSTTQNIRVKIESRSGLIARGRLLDVESPLVSGTVLREQIRQLPKPGELKLRIGLDESLGTDVGQAEQVLRQMERIEILPFQQSEIDYIFGRMTESYRIELISKRISDPPPVDSVGLFLSGLDPILETFGPPNELVVSAIDRLKPKLYKLLAVRIFKTALNANSSLLNVEASILSDRRQIGQLVHTRAVEGSSYSELTQVPTGEAISFQIINKENYPLYIFIVVINAEGDLLTLYPYDLDSPEESLLLSPFQSVEVPGPRAEITFTVTGSSGDVEIFMIVSRDPLTNTMRFLKNARSSYAPVQQDRIPPISYSLDLVGDFLLDLNGDEGADVSKTLALYTKFSVRK